MAALGSQSIASSYEQLLHVDRDGGGDTTNHVSVKDGDNGTTFGFTIASDALMMTSTNRLEFGDNATYISQKTDGHLDLDADTSIDINTGTLDLSGQTVDVTLNAAADALNFDSNTLSIDASNNRIGIGTASPSWPLHIIAADGGPGDNKYALGVYNNESTAGRNYGLYVAGGTNSSDFNLYCVDQAAAVLFGVRGSGEITAPLQPAFLATPASAQSNIAADDSEVIVVFGTEVFDQGGDFASNTFTAPVTGRYQFNANIRVDNIDTGAEYYSLKFKTTNRNVILDIFDPDFADQDIPYFFTGGSALIDMDASDTCVVVINQNGGTAQSDIQSGTNTSFSGYLAC